MRIKGLKTIGLKTIGSLLLAVLLFLAVFDCSVSVKAAEIDPDAPGSISITLNDLGTNPEGVEFTCYHVGNITTDPEWKYELTTDFQAAKVDLNDIGTAQKQKAAAKALADFARANSGQIGAASVWTVKTDKDGKCVFGNLTGHGLYLVVQTKTAEYGIVSPFLAAIPYMKDGENWSYDVVTKPKGEHFPPPETTNDDDGGGGGGHKDNTPPGSSHKNPPKQTEVVIPPQPMVTVPDPAGASTGDATPIWPYAAAAVLSAGAILWIILGNRKHRKPRKSEKT